MRVDIMGKVKCSYCGKKFYISPRKEVFKKHFCNRDCYIAFMKKDRKACLCEKVDTVSLRKIKRLAELRKQIQEGKIKYENINYSHNRKSGISSME